MSLTRASRSSRAWLGAGVAAILAQPDPTAIPDSLVGRYDVLSHPDLVTAGAYHRVLPALYVSLKDCDELSRESRRAMMAEHHTQAFRHSGTLRDLRSLGVLLDRVGCRWAVLKGPYLAEVVHARPDLRSYGDLDVVVDHRALPDVVAALEGSGAHFLDRNWTLIREGERAQVSLILAGGTPLDLHWHLLNRGRIRHAFRLDMDAVLDRARRCEIGDAVVPVLDDVDALIHLGLHGALSGGSKLVWLHDIHALVQRRSPDPDLLVERARGSGSALAVAVMLARSRAALGTTVHPHLLDRLASRGPWRAATALAHVVRPVPTSFGRRGTGRTLIRATRADQLSSLREFRRTSTRNVWARIAHDTSRRGLVAPDSGTPAANPLWEERGTTRDRDEFFAEVARATNI